MILSIQYLRGIAALFVVLYHIAFKDQQYSLGNFGFEIGEMGVDIFFVISGFVMYYVSIRKSNTLRSVYEFLKRRALRILPLYWIVTTVALVIYLVSPENVNRFTGSTDILNSYTLFPSFTRYLIPVGWSLSYELYFYLLFCVALLFSRYRAAVISVLLLVPAMIGLYYSFPPIEALRAFLTSSFLLEFFYGILAAVIFLNPPKQKRVLGVVAFILFVILIGLYFRGYQSGIRGVDIGLPAMMLVVSIVMFEEFFGEYPIKWLGFLGDISYSLYLAHLLALGAAALLYRKIAIHTYWSESVFLAVMLASSLLLGAATYRWIERSLMLYFKKRFY